MTEPPRIAPADFAALARAADLVLHAERLAELHRAYAAIEAMRERVNAPRELAVEPATIFVPRVEP